MPDLIDPVKKNAKDLLKVYDTRYSQAVTQPGTNLALQDLTAVIGREPVLSLWCGRRRKQHIKLSLLIVTSFAPLQEKKECIND